MQWSTIETHFRAYPPVRRAHTFLVSDELISIVSHPHKPFAHFLMGRTLCLDLILNSPIFFLLLFLMRCVGFVFCVKFFYVLL